MTNPTEAEVAAIVRGLSKRTRNVFDALGEPSFAGWVAIADLEPLFRAGLIAVDDTPLGLAVRQHLLAAGEGKA